MNSTTDQPQADAIKRGRWFGNTSRIAFRLPLYVVSVLLISALVAGAVIIIPGQIRLRAQLEDGLASIAGIQSARIGQQLAEHLQLMNSLAAEPAVQQAVLQANREYGTDVQGSLAEMEASYTAARAAAGDLEGRPSAMDPMLQNVLAEIPLLDNAANSTSAGSDTTNTFLLADVNGGLVAASYLPARFDFGGEVWYSSIMEGETSAFITGPAFFMDLPSPRAVSFGVPIYHPDNPQQVVGVMHSTLDYASITNSIIQGQFSGSGRSMLVDSAGNVLYAASTINELNQMVLPTLDNTELHEITSPVGNTFFFRPEPVVAEIEPVDNLRWHVVAVQNKQAALAPLTQVIIPAAALSITVGLALVVGLYALYIRPLSWDLDRLRQSAELLQTGAEASVEVNRRDELGLFAETFRTMSDRLRRQIQQQEAIIERRTSDLARQTNLLQAASQVAAAANASLDMGQLMASTIDLIRDQFGYYHASIFIVDEQKKFAVVRESTGEVGSIMKQHPHMLAIGSNSIVGWATANLKPRVALDVQNDPTYYSNPLLPYTRSEVALPLVAQGEMLGALDVQSQDPNAFSDEDVSILQLMADQVASAIFNARTFARTQLQAEQRRTVVSIGQHIGQLQSAKEIYEAACTQIHGSFGFDAVHLVHSDGLSWTVLAAVASDEEFQAPVGIQRPIQAGLIGQTISRASPSLVSSHVRGDAAFFDEGFPQIAGEAAVPLYVSGEIFGAIGVYSFRPAALTNNDLDLLALLAETVGSAITQSRLLEEVEQNLSELNRLYQQITGASLAEEPRMAAFYGLELSAGMSPTVNIVPIEIRGQRLGQVLIDVGDQPLTPEEEELANAIVEQAAITIENSRLFTQTQIRLRETETLYSMAALLSGTLDEAETHLHASRTISKLLQISRCEITRWNPVTNTLDVMVTFEMDRLSKRLEQVETRIPSISLESLPNAAAALHTRESRISRVDDPDVHPTEKDTLRQMGQETFIQAPVMFGDTVIAVYFLYRTDDMLPFTDENLRLVRTVAGQIGVAANNARLATQTRLQYQATARLNAAATGESIMAALGESRILPVDSVTSYLFDTYSGDNGHRELLLYADWHRDATKRSQSGTRVPVTRFPYAWQVKLDSPKVVYNVYDSPDIDSASLKWLVGDDNLAGLVILPLEAGDRKIGFITWQTQAPQRAVPEQIRQLEALGDQAAIAVQSLRALDMTQEALAAQSRQRLQLQTAAEVASAAGSILNLEELLGSVVDLIQRRFELYYVGLFLREDDQAVLKAGSGQAGQIQLRRGHRHPLDGEAMVSLAINSGRAIVEQNILQAQTWVPNPILPETRSELAVPLRARERVIGALTAQSREANAFHTEDVEVLQTLADQLAVAIDNASLFNEVQTANVQLRQMDSLKTQFLANMSHELRTPLNSIIGFSRLMLKGIDGPVTTEQVEDLSSIHTSGQHLLRLINDILDMSKIEAGKMALAFSKVNLEEIGSTVISSVEPLLEGKPVEIVLNIEAGLPEIDADAIKVRQVMINLLSNAVKFTDRGVITLSMSQHDDENVLITVQDSGKGIAKDDYDALFRPFEQLDASPTREIGGTGLGLPISRNLVVLHGGDLWVESELGVGSTFLMTLPIFQTESVVEATFV